MLRQRARSDGFTLLEVLISLALVGVIVVNMAMVVRSGAAGFETSSIEMDAEIRARRAMDRIALALMGATRDSLWLSPEAPDHTRLINYEMSLGLEEGEIVSSPPQRIELVEEQLEVRWTNDPESEGSVSAVWAKAVTDLLEGEVENGVDDNGNGLIDERGLSFTVDRESIVIRLTVGLESSSGQLATKTLERRVTCRN